MEDFESESLRLKAIVAFGADYVYTARNGTLGPTLYVHAPTKEASAEARRKIPSEFEGVRVLVLFGGADFYSGSMPGKELKN